MVLLSSVAVFCSLLPGSGCIYCYMVPHSQPVKDFSISSERKGELTFSPLNPVLFTLHFSFYFYVQQRKTTRSFLEVTQEGLSVWGQTSLSPHSVSPTYIYSSSWSSCTHHNAGEMPESILKKNRCSILYSSFIFYSLSVLLAVTVHGRVKHNCKQRTSLTVQQKWHLLNSVYLIIKLIKFKSNESPAYRRVCASVHRVKTKKKMGIK